MFWTTFLATKKVYRLTGVWRQRCLKIGRGARTVSFYDMPLYRRNCLVFVTMTYQQPWQHGRDLLVNTIENRRVRQVAHTPFGVYGLF